MLKKVKQIDRGRVDIGVGVSVGLSGITAAGSGEKADPKMVAFQQVLDRLTTVRLRGIHRVPEGVASNPCWR